jgi:hypothetical protein
MAFGRTSHYRSPGAVIAFLIIYLFCNLTVGVNYLGPLTFVVTAMVAWDLGLMAALAWVGLIHVLLPFLIALAGVGPFFLFSQSREAVLAIMLTSLVVDAALAYLTARLRLLTEQLRDSRSALLATNAQLQDTLAEVKELRGFLPICAWCKDIRDVSGNWEKMESYISRHSHAVFTHSLCPKCMEEQLRAARA